ncbi:tetratricopeptide repeat protein [Oesophagostomum dentatum]|uniref:Tetratricopeptide repeat protein n=1 Tax=Oesophagostomum dentatum TaxID=61180 RepID=A0A0B1SZP2_OESDE|nr:tetratricopeptide repeat protein [Oesophagostomum dentatum]
MSIATFPISTTAKMESDLENEEPPIPYPSDIDNSGVIEEDSGEPLPMGDPNKETNDEDLEKANEARDKAMAAFSEGNFEDAVKHFTEAIELNPGSAILHAKRANVLLKLKRPRAAIADCDKAISINPDSAQGYKFRGRAHR